jgi:hypothetical protein
MTRAVWIATNIHGRRQENVRTFFGVSELLRNIADVCCVVRLHRSRVRLPECFSREARGGALARGEDGQNYSDAARQDVGF